MKVYLTTDTHFGHTALAERYRSRPADFMEKTRQAWCKNISPTDLVVHLGDVVVGGRADWDCWMSGLPGRKVLVRGNHDTRSMAWYMENGFDFCCDSFSWNSFGLKILFSHAPIDCLEGFDLNIHGHLHQGVHRSRVSNPHYFLLALENTGYAPVQLSTIVKQWQGSEAGGLK